MNRAVYFIGSLATRCVKGICIRERVHFAHRVPSDRPMILAVSHISHLEPMFVTLQHDEPIHWMTRIEFYSTWWGSLLLKPCGAFPVDRFGFTLPAVRKAVALLDSGRTIGMFPEGGVAQGGQSILRGAPFKQGVCTIAIRTGTPVVPVVVLGTDALNRVMPWIPAKRGTVWMAYGQPIDPPATRTSNRRTRAAHADRVSDAFVQTYHELLEAEGLNDSDVP